MKKVTVLLMTMAFALTLGTAYAGGNSYDSIPMNPALDEIGPAASGFEGVSGGGVREKGWVANTGQSYDSIPMNPALDESNPAASGVEGVSGGGAREKGWVANTGRSYDSIPMNPALE